jgi:hypothetical protein
MTINYPDGRVVEAILLSRGNDTLRAAVQGEDDAQIFNLISGTWVSEEDGPVRIEFAWEHCDQAFRRLAIGALGPDHGFAFIGSADTGAGALGPHARGRAGTWSTAAEVRAYRIRERRATGS